ncbi:MAG TPA: TlpA disulfide reductase family protein [Thermodesulfobacteriota bacterium]|nr:TlpA disulfide reductase family protein [Thermodesulfobacteriota bacterium]
MKYIPKILQISTFLLIGCFIAILAISILGNKDNKPRISPLIGKNFPNHDIELFSGDKINIDKLKGNTLLINFWASWCNPCKEEFPALEASWLKHKNNNVIFLGINILDDKDQAEHYLQQYKSNYPNGVDIDGNIAVDLGIGGVPETFFVNDKGIIVEKYVGPLTEEIIDFYINKTKLSNG